MSCEPPLAIHAAPPARHEIENEENGGIRAQAAATQARRPHGAIRVAAAPPRRRPHTKEKRRIDAPLSERTPTGAMLPRGARPSVRRPGARAPRHSTDFTMSSITFFASPKTIIVLSM